MKITVKGSLLVDKLKAQRARCMAKRQEAEDFLREHSKQHEPPAEGFSGQSSASRAFFARRARQGTCVFEVQMQALMQHIMSHIRRIDAAIEVIDSEAAHTLSLRKYLSSYVDSPYDNLTFPAPDVDDDAAAMHSLLASSLPKAN